MTALAAAVAVSAWTNCAGCAIAAAPLSLEAGKVEMRLANGAVREFPQSLFPLDELRRMRRMLGMRDPLPRQLEEMRAVYARDLRMLSAREAGGAIGSDDAAARRATIRGAWQLALEDARWGLSREDIEYWKERLK